MEEWRPVVGYEGLYEVSNMGRVKSLERTARCGLNGGCYRTVPERILKLNKDSNGYLQVNLCKDGKRKNCLVHGIVAQAFLENPMGYTEVNHIDEDKTNNCMDNLEWCSRSYNLTYNDRAKKVGKKFRGRKQTEEQIKKKSKPVFSVNKESGLIMWWKSASEAGRVLDISQSDITQCCKGKYKSMGGFYWYYADTEE